MKYELHFLPADEPESGYKELSTLLPDTEYVRQIGYEPSDGTTIVFEEKTTGLCVNFGMTGKYYLVEDDKLSIFVTIEVCDMDPEEFRDYVERTWTPYSTPTPD